MKKIQIMLLMLLSPCLYAVIDAGWTGSPEAVKTVYSAPDGQSFPGITLSGPGKWSLEKKTDQSKAQNVTIRFYTSDSGSLELTLNSGSGKFSRVIKIFPGEQLKIIPRGTFNRIGSGMSWSKLSAINIELKSQVKIVLTGISFHNRTNCIPVTGLWMLKKITPVNHIGTAWPLYAIVDQTVYPKVENAGKSLQKWLNELYKVKLPLNPKDIKTVKKLNNIILVGREAVIKADAVAEAELKKQGFNGFVVTIKNGSLCIAGESLQGTNYGVYKFLEKQGLKFFARNVFTKKYSPGNVITAVEFADKPFFNGKRITAPFCIYGDSSSGFSLGDPRKAGIDKVYPCDKTLWIDHTAAFLVPKKLYLKEHPEYYLLGANGKRLSMNTPDVRLMLCQTNSGGIRIAAERAIKWIAKQKNRKYFVIQQGDDMEACCCAECKAKRAQGWNESDLMLNWINSIARIIAKKYPDKYLLCYAYVSTQPAPQKLSPEKNVQLLYCPWPNLISAPNGFRDFNAPENVIAGSQLNDWLKISNPESIGIYDYNAGRVLTLRGMADRVKWSSRKGMKGGFWYCGQNKTFAKLFTYVHAQLNWNPFQNVRTLEKEFIKSYYGKAAPVMGNIIESIYDRLDEDNRNNGRIPAPEFFSKEFTAQLIAWFKEAIKLAPEKLKKEIANDESSVLYNGLLALKMTNWHDASPEQLEVLCKILPAYIKLELNKTFQPDRVRKQLTGLIWNCLHIKSTPEVLAELEKNPLQAIKKYQITKFTKKIPNGIIIPAMAFSGGEGPRYYKWKCEGKVAAWIRGSMTEQSVMKAKFNWTEDIDKAYTLGIDGQDSDKLWCPPAPIRISINDTVIFEGPNGFKKHGWSLKKFPVQPGVLHKGDNIIKIENLANSDSRSAHWFMVSEARIELSSENKK